MLYKCYINATKSLKSRFNPWKSKKYPFYFVCFSFLLIYARGGGATNIAGGTKFEKFNLWRISQSSKNDFQNDFGKSIVFPIFFDGFHGFPSISKDFRGFQRISKHISLHEGTRTVYKKDQKIIKNTYFLWFSLISWISLISKHLYSII